MIDVSDNYGMNGKTLFWKKVSGETYVDTAELMYEYEIVHTAVHEWDFDKKISVTKSELFEHIIKKRCEFVTQMFKKRLNFENWHDVLFNDKTYFEWESKNTIWITRKIGKRYVFKNVYIKNNQFANEKNKKKFHAWMMMKWNFKFFFVFYDSGNVNDKMIFKCYHENILKLWMKNWFTNDPLNDDDHRHWGQDFVLKENGNSDHGFGSTVNEVAKWKQAKGLKCYKNVARSSDLSIIENCWSASKQNAHKISRYDDEMIIQIFKNGWKDLQQKAINKMINSMPKRLRDVLKQKNQYTAY